MITKKEQCLIKNKATTEEKKKWNGTNKKQRARW